MRHATIRRLIEDGKLKATSAGNKRFVSREAVERFLAIVTRQTGKFNTVIWEEVSDDPRLIYPVTAYEVPPPHLVGSIPMRSRRAMKSRT
jgi:excisionase family DNA binding protein